MQMSPEFISCRPATEAAPSPVPSIPANVPGEWLLIAALDYPDPFMSINAEAHVVCPDGTDVIVPMFWTGGNQWKLRFASPSPGRYHVATICSETSDTGLHDRHFTFEITPYVGDNRLLRHGPLRVGSDRRHLEHADGTPFLWLADSWWHGMSGRLKWPEDFRRLTQDRAQKGFSVIQFAAGFGPDVAPFDKRNANEAGHPWTSGFTSVNPAYFDRVDKRIACLVDYGLVPNVVGCWAYTAAWMTDRQLTAYWRYLIARYGAAPVVWTLAGESTLPWYHETDKAMACGEQKRRWTAVGQYVKEQDPYRRVLTVHPGPQSGRLSPLDDTSSLDMIMLQPGHGGYETLATARAQFSEARRRFPQNPVLAGEVCFEGMHGDCREKIQRILFWSFMLSGAAGHSYGAEGIWQFNDPDRLFGPSPQGHAWSNVPWQESYEWPGSAHVGTGKAILERYDWWRFEPHQEWVEPCANDADPLGPYAAGVPGKVRVAYFPRKIAPWGTRFRMVRLKQGGTYEAVFVDPTNGEEHPIGRIAADTNGEWPVPVAPVLRDWVVVLVNTDGYGSDRGE